MFSTDDFMDRKFDLINYNCWDFLRDLILALGLGDIGKRTPDPPSLRAMRDRVAQEKAQFTKLDKRVSPCIVLMERPPFPSHVGLWWRGRVFHLRDDSGPKYEPLEVASLGFSNVEYYACSASQ